jgi:hypothetical protein
LKEVLSAISGQRVFEATSNADVAAAQEKYYKQSENEKNTVRVARWVQESGGLIHDPPATVKYGLFGRGAKQSLAQGEEAKVVDFTPSQSYK